MPLACSAFWFQGDFSSFRAGQPAASAHIGQFSPLNASSGFVVHPAIWILSIHWGWLRQQKPFEFFKSHCPGREPPSSRKGRVLPLQIVWWERTFVRARNSLDSLFQHWHIVHSVLTPLTKSIKKANYRTINVVSTSNNQFGCKTTVITCILVFEK